MRKLKVIALTVVGIGLSAVVALPQEEKSMAMMRPTEIKWAAAPANLPHGAQMSVLAGDPTKEGLFIVRYKFPANYKIAPHFHPSDEHITVISGTFMMGMGDKVDRAKLRALPAGSHAVMPAKAHHFAMTTTGAVVERTALGPFGLTYVNAADDPSRKQ